MIDLADFRPLGDRVLLRRIEEGHTSALVIPDVAKTAPRRGIVLRVGPGKRNGSGALIPLVLKPGDVLRYQSNDLDTGEYIVIQEADVLAVEEPISAVEQILGTTSRVENGCQI